MKCIVLVGYMCVGKTTVGRQLAKRLNCGFYDLDWYIEERFHKKIPVIFAEEGEERFRDLERRMLREVAEFENIVLACGGGTPTRFDNMEFMNGSGANHLPRSATRNHSCASEGEQRHAPPCSRA